MTEMQYLDLHGERVAYLDEGAIGDGEREVILLLHGMAGSSQTWRPLMRSLARNFRVIAPDLLGHGSSTKPRSDYSLGAFAVLVRDLLDELGIARATIVGHSLGGGIAMQFIYQHPDYGRRLVLIGSGGLGPDVGLLLRLASLPGAELVLPVIAPRRAIATGDRFWLWLQKAGIESPRGGEMWRSFSSLSDGPTRQAFLRTLRAVVDHRGQAVSALNRLNTRTDFPALVIWGERDAIIPVKHAYAAQQARPDVRLEVLPGVGHFPHAERPVDVADLISDFVSCNPAVGDPEIGVDMTTA
ncbi:MAG: alpha/beta fold hydrolase [Mycobacterium sp.]|nr:alpha/beta fold hydrolase [Mycobacterium sp.]